MQIIKRWTKCRDVSAVVMKRNGVMTGGHENEKAFRGSLSAPSSGRTSDPNVRLTVHNTGGIHHALVLCYTHHAAVHGGSVMVFFPATLTVLQHREDPFRLQL